MVSAVFYERRKQSMAIDSVNRRTAQRRNGQRPVTKEQRRLASQTRRYEREAFRIPVCLKLQGREISGDTRDISPEGLLVFTDAAVSAGTPLALQFSFGESVCYLNISGQVAFCISAGNGAIGRHAVGIKFSAIRDFEQKVLTNVVQELRQNLITQEKSLLSVFVSTDTPAREAVNLSIGSPRVLEKSDDFCDRRFASRIATGLPVMVEVKDPITDAVFGLPCDLMNLSEGGASFLSRKLIETPRGANLEAYLPYGAQAIRISGQIVWNHSTVLNPQTKEYHFKYGMQFIDTEDVAQRELGQFIGRHMLSKELLCERRITTTIVSELIRFKNRNGKNIVGFYDHLKDRNSSDNPFILIPPAYGETKKEAIGISYYLVKNGFNVIRYDNTDHVGESDGEIFDTSLTKMKADLLSAVDCVEKFGCKKIGVVATSLAARASIKAAAEDRRINLLVCFVPVVNLQDTLKAVYNEDLIGVWLRGAANANVLGFEVGRNFLDAAVGDHFHDLQSAQKDLRELSIPAIFFAAENDPWVNLEDIKTAFKSISAPEKKIFIISDATHRLDGNLVVVKSMQRQIVRSCLKYLCRRETSDIAEPNIRETAIQNRVEKERVKNLKSITQEDEKNFWRKYLDKFHYIVNVHDYWNLLGSITDSLGRVNEEEIILDAGCGNGSFGAFLLIHTFYKNKDSHLQRGFPLFSYVGLDFVKSGLKEARSAHENLRLELVEKLGSRRLVSCSYILGDLTKPLIFKNDSFDKICCNLVISYLPHPLFTLRELVRVLKPGGKLVITSLKPHADLTTVYRNSMIVAKCDEEIEEGRKLLNNSGAIKYKEAEGYYHFFSERELSMMIALTGARKIRTHETLANQANLIVAEKS